MAGQVETRLAFCTRCGQACPMSDAWTVRGLCDTCRGSQYGKGEQVEPLPLFVPEPTQLPGQLALEAE